MRTTEIDLSKDKDKLLTVANALSNMKRLELLSELKKNTDTSHKKLAEELGIKSSSISFHISPLIEAGLVIEEISKGLKGRNKKTPKLITTEIVIKL